MTRPPGAVNLASEASACLKMFRVCGITGGGLPRVLLKLI